MDERELRIITHSLNGKPVKISEDLGQLVPINPAQLVERVIAHPQSTTEFRSELKSFLEAEHMQISVCKSVLAPHEVN
jgi:hypothetical protein